MSEYLDLEAELSEDEFEDSLGNKIQRNYDDDEDILEETAEDRAFIAPEDDDLDDADDVLFHEQVNNAVFQGDSCSICGDRIEDRATPNNVKCGHFFCFICISNWTSVGAAGIVRSFFD
jgi:hypothetical protein